MPGGGPERPSPQSEEIKVPFTPVSWAIIAVACLIFGWGLIDPDVVELGVLYGPAVKSGQWWRVATFLFTHGGVVHLLFNMSTVWTLGRVLEVNIGSARFTLVSIIGGVGSACFVLWLNPTVGTVGASGMILSWLGAMLPLATKAGRSQLLMVLAQVVVISLLPKVSWAGHLGGLVFGLGCGLALRRGAEFFRLAAPVLMFVTAVLTFLAGIGQLAIR